LRLRGGETIVVRVPPPAPADVRAEAIAIDVVYEDDDLLVVDKAAGMVVHPSAGHGSGTLVNAVLGHAPNLAGVGGELRPGVVHRLDRDTSGLIVVAKNDRTLWALLYQFRRKSVEKVYLALVDGRPPSHQGRIEAAVGRDPHHRQRMAVVAEGKGRQAVTEYRVREVFPEHVWLEARPLTGRTHQIRVHLSFLGCPVAGDRVYGLRKPTLDLSRQMLHAWRLRFKLPGAADERTFEAAIPPDMMLALELARGRAAEVARS
jgi:23S rRNA pseudouridine1911/1915/1917 synthase